MRLTIFHLLYIYIYSENCLALPGSYQFYLHRRGVRLQCSTSILTFFVNFKKYILKSEDGKQNGVLLRWKFHEIIFTIRHLIAACWKTAAFAQIIPNKSVLKFKVHMVIFRSSSNHYRGFCFVLKIIRSDWNHHRRTDLS